MTRLFLIFFLLFAFGTFQASAQTEKLMFNAPWLTGTWQSKMGSSTIYESWKQLSETEFAGRSYMLKNADTVVFETIKIVQKPEGWFYIPVVKNQNKGLPVQFLLKKSTDSEFIFENLQHDFPQVIHYKLTAPEVMTAEVSATKKAKTRKQTFPMNRVK